MPQRSVLVHLVPVLPLVFGQILSVWRFRAGDEIWGLALGLGGVLAMMATARWMFRTGAPADVAERANDFETKLTGDSCGSTGGQDV